MKKEKLEPLAYATVLVNKYSREDIILSLATLMEREWSNKKTIGDLETKVSTQADEIKRLKSKLRELSQSVSKFEIKAKETKPMNGKKQKILTDEQVKFANECRLNGHSLQDIAIWLEVSKTTVLRATKGTKRGTKSNVIIV